MNSNDAAAPESVYHAVVVPTAADSTKQKSVEVLLDTPHVKLVSITLRGGASLGEHRTPMAVTLQAMTGTGTVRVDSSSVPLGPARVVVLAPGAAHAITPAAAGELVLLVHHLKPMPVCGEQA